MFMNGNVIYVLRMGVGVRIENQYVRTALYALRWIATDYLHPT